MTLDGYSFASKLEAATYKKLKEDERSGLITLEQVQAEVRLTDAGILYKPDFLITDHAINAPVWCEAKGYETPEWRLKLRLWEYYGPGILRIYRGTWQYVSLHKEVRPKK